MSVTIAIETNLEVIQCANCAMSFAVPPRFLKERRNDHKTFYCPHGHDNYYPQKSDEEKLREELANEKRWHSLADERARRAAQDAEHYKQQRNGYKGQLALVKKRVANGICPCCNRYFVALHEHMKNKHAEFLVESGLLTVFDAGTPELFDAAVDTICKDASANSAVTYRSIAKKLKELLFPVATP